MSMSFQKDLTKIGRVILSVGNAIPWAMIAD